MGYTATKLALLSKDKKAVAHVLLDYGVDPSDNYFLETALGWKDYELLKKLIAQGVDVNVLPGSDSTTLTRVIFENDPTALRILLEAGADPEKPNARGETPYDVAVRLQRKKILEILNEYTN